MHPEHAANSGQIFAWDDAPPTGHPGSDYGCRCWAEPYFGLMGVEVPSVVEKPIEPEYNPEDDTLYMTGVYVFGYPVKAELDLYSDFIDTVGKTYSIDPNLIRGILTNEAITRAGAGIVEAIPSGINDIFGGFGTYGPAQLGPQAREAVGLSIIGTITYPGAIIGAANFLHSEKQKLIEEGISNPTNAQIASRYNMGSWNNSTPITNYGVRVEYLIRRFYSDIQK